MATVGSKNEATFSDGSGPGGDVLNVNTVNHRLEIPNASTIQFYSDNYITPGLLLNNSGVALVVSTSAPTIINASTIVTAGLGVSRTIAGGAATGVIMQVGTFGGQSI